MWSDVGEILVALWFFEAHCQKRAQLFLGECDFHRNYGKVVILLSFLCSYDNLTLKLHQKKGSYPDERWWVVLEGSKKSIKIHHECDARPLIKS